MKKAYEIFEVLIDPDEVADVQEIWSDNHKSYRITMMDKSSVVVPAAVYAFMRDDIERAISSRMILECIDQVTEGLLAILTQLRCEGMK